GALFSCTARSGCAALRLRLLFFLSSRRRHTRFKCDWSSDVCSSDLILVVERLDHLGLVILALGDVMGEVHVLLDVTLEVHRHERSEERRVGKECRARWSPNKR